MRILIPDLAQQDHSSSKIAVSYGLILEEYYMQRRKIQIWLGILAICTSLGTPISTYADTQDVTTNVGDKTTIKSDGSDKETTNGQEDSSDTTSGGDTTVHYTEAQLKAMDVLVFATIISSGGGDASSYGQNALKHSIEVAQLSGLLAAEVGTDIRLAKRAGLLHDIGKSIDHEVEGSHIQIGVDLCRKYKESPIVINAVEAHHGDVEPESLIAGIVQAADAISAARPGARRETLETYTNRLKQLEDITNSFKGVDKSYAIQAGREVRIMVLPDHVNDSDMVLLARDISKQIEAELEYPGQIKVSVIRESRVVDYAK